MRSNRVERGAARDAIAVVGMAGRFPGARDLEAFWRNLADGRESLRALTVEEMEAEGIPRSVSSHAEHVRAAFVLDDTALFDAGLFGLQPREAEATDPQQRLFLECAWEALDNAGHDPASFPGAIGLYAGCSFSSYLFEVLAHPTLVGTLGRYRVMLGNDKDFLATWAAYKLDLKGPALTVQTACSTSLVAVHLASQSLLDGECDMALAGGVSIQARQKTGYRYREGGILSPDGRCRPFDVHGRGTAPGNGVGVVVLRRLSDALADGDHVRAILRSSAVNNDGSLKIGYTAPSEEGQVKVIAEALALAGVDAATIGHVEAHGTATALGDPIEVAALQQVFEARTDSRGFCALTSVKANVGHLDAAAGVAGLIKSVLALEHGALPPSPNFTAPNPHIDLTASPFFVPTSLLPWPRGEEPRRAAVSSFGIGGTNAHVILEEAPPRDVAPSSRPLHLLVLSARSEAALERAGGTLADHLAAHPDLDPGDVALTLATGRRGFPHRRALIVASREEAVAALRGRGAGRSWSREEKPRHRPVVFLFPGQGSQHPGMGRDLYRHEPRFRELVDRGCERLEPELGLDLRRWILAEGEEAARASEELRRTELAQPALFVVEHALATVWSEWLGAPEAMLGHSVGELVAACLAGVVSLDDALGLVAARGRLMGELPGGAMLAVPLPEEEVLPLLDDPLVVAVVNAPSRVVVAGDAGRIERLAVQLRELGVESRRLVTSHAFHSPAMEPILARFEEIVRGVRLHPPRIPYFSNVTGDWIRPEEATAPAYWARQMRSTVRFAPALRHLLADADRILVEVGPGGGLTRLVQGFEERARGQVVVPSLPHARQSEGDLGTVLRALAQVWVGGGDVRWRSVYASHGRRRVPLPPYPFERRRYWVGPALPAPAELPPGPTASPAAVPPPASASLSPDASSHPHRENTEVTMSPSESPPGTVRTRFDDVLDILAEIVHELTGLDRRDLDPQAHFLEVGVDSLLMIRATQAIEDRFGVKVSVVQLFEELTNLDRLARFLDDTLPPDVTFAPPLAEEPPQVAAPPPAAAGAPPPPAAPSQAASDPRTPPPTPTPLLASGPAPDAVSRLLQEQMELMGRQLELLRSVAPPAGTAAVGVAPSAPPEPVRSAPASSASPASAPASPRTPARRQANPSTGSFGPFQPLDVSPGEELPPHQKRSLDAFIERYVKRTRGSKRWTERYRPYLADTRGSIGFRRLWKEIVYPIVGERSRGSRVWDIDGNEYVDISLGYGLHLFGHTPPFVEKAIAEQLERSIAIGPQSDLAGEVAELVCELTGLDRAMFCNSGTEAVMAAIRAARVATRRDTIVYFNGAYHGWADPLLARSIERDGQRTAVPIASGVPASAVGDVVVLDYGAPEALDEIRRLGDRVAAVLVEPVQSRRPDLQPREFLHRLRELTRELGIVLVFDEMVTGFRIHAGGAQAHFGVQADIATYGKFVAGGLPIGVIAGKGPFLDVLDGGLWRFGDDSYPRAEKMFFAGAFFKHPLTMASMRAVLSEIKARGPELHETLNRRTRRFAEGLNTWFAEQRVPAEVVCFGSLFRFRFDRELRYQELFPHHLIDRGVFYSPESGNCFVCTEHSDEDLERVATAVRGAVEELREGRFWPTPPSDDGGGRDPRGRGDGERREEHSGRSVAAAPASVAPQVRELSATDPEGSHAATRMGPKAAAERRIDFGIFFFGHYEAAHDPEKYELLIEATQFADRHGFSAVSVPERHFHPMGGFSPNPSVVAAALSRETERIQLRAGSVVVPLHHPVRIAEEWSVVDNLSGGRVGVSFASGWHPNDFVFAPDTYDRRREIMMEGIDTVRRLWRGEELTVVDGAGNEIQVKLYPLPVQRQLPIWLTAAHEPTYVRAGKVGAGVLGNLVGYPFEELPRRIARYRETLEEHGHDPASGHVTMLVHSFVGESTAAARQVAREPFRDYLRSSLSLIRNQVESFGQGKSLERLSAEEREHLLLMTADRYLAASTLVGSSDSCVELVERLIEAGVDEIGCFIDFGVPMGRVLESLDGLADLVHRFDRPAATSREPLPATLSDARTPIEEEGTTAPATEGQRGLWILSKIGPDASRAYNESVIFRFRGDFDAAAMRRALQHLVDRHEAMRTTFGPDGSEQRFAARLEVELPTIDLSQGSEEERQRAFRAWAEREASEVFDLERGPLLRTRLAKLGADNHALAFTTHHIVSDSRSFGVVLRELGALYLAERNGTEAKLPSPVQFREHLAEVSGEELERRAAEAEQYWLERFADGVPLLELPTDRPRGPVQTFRGARAYLDLEPRLCGALRQSGSGSGGTLFMTLLAAFTLLLHRLTGQDEVVVGSDAADRRAMRKAALVGYAVNPLPLYSRLAGDPPFTAFLGGLKRELLTGYEHQDYSFSRLVQKLEVFQKDRSRPPLFAASINVEGAGALRLEGLDVEISPNYPATSRFDLYFNHLETESGIRVVAEYNSDLFDRTTVGRWLRSYRRLLEGIASRPGDRVGSLPLLSAPTRQQVLREWNDTAAELGGDAVTRFEQRARAAGKALAVTCGEERMSYGDLDRRADRCAVKLRKQGVGNGERVALVADRGIDFLVALLGILKAGGVYLPLDPGDPVERLAWVIRGSGARVVVAARSTVPALEEELEGSPEGPDFLPLEEIAHLGGKARRLPRRLAADSLAYVVYTSGSTGLPKGAMVHHAGMLNHLLAKIEELDLHGGDVVAQTASQCFDISIWQFLAPLLVGGSVAVIPRAVVQEPKRLLSRLASHGCTVFETVPSLLRLIVDEMREAREEPPGPSALRWLLSTGEALPPDLAGDWLRLRPDVPLLNAYGPTECSDDVTHRELARLPGEGLPRVPVGRALRRTRLFVVDRAWSAVPIGTPGELCVGGSGVGRGYLGDPRRTAEVFVPDPFGEEPGGRLYRTGDVAVRLPDGDIDFRGRRDHQVKVRGFRVELGEIEAVLTRQPSVSEAVVLAWASGADRRLVAYLLPEGGETISVEALRDAAVRRLPGYMVPAVFVVVDELPRLASGKVDRANLPEPDWGAARSGGASRAPRTPGEEILAGIWGEALGIDGVSVDDDFFELGGHSLLATQMLVRIRRAFAVDLSLRVLFEAPTLGALARRVDEAVKSNRGLLAPPVTRAARGERLPVSFGQQRLWFIDQLEPGSPAYNLPSAVRVAGWLDVEVLAHTLGEIGRRHESLRTRFEEVDGEPFQRVEERASLIPVVVDLRGLPEGARQEELRRQAGLEAVRPFDLAAGPFLRCRVLYLGSEDSAALLTLHHVVGDAWSNGVLIRELGALYSAFAAGEPSPLPELEIQYPDFAVWQRRWLSREVLSEQVGFWKGALAGAPPLISLPVDHSRPAIQRFRGAYLTFALERELSERVRELARRQGVTLFMGLLTAFEVLLAHWAESRDIVVASPVAYRNQMELEGLIGFFANVLVLRTDLAGDPTFEQVLGRVREVTLDAYAHQDVPFEKLVEELRVERDLGFTPLAQVAFALDNTPQQGMEVSQLELRPLEVDFGTTPWDLVLAMVDGGPRLSGTLQYNTDLFERSTVERLHRELVEVLERAVARPDLRLSEILEPLSRRAREEQLRRQQERKKAYLKKLKAVERSVGV